MSSDQDHKKTTGSNAVDPSQYKTHTADFRDFGFVCFYFETTPETLSGPIPLDALEIEEVRDI